MKVGKKDLGGEDDNEIGKGEEGARANEAGIANGSSANDGSAQSEWIAIELPEGATSIATGTFQGQYGSFQIIHDQASGVYKYQYTLNKNYKHDAGADIAYDVDKIVVTIEDDNGNTGKASIYADIVDDSPSVEFVATDGDTAEDEYAVSTGSCLVYTPPSPRHVSTSRMPTSALT